MTVVPPEVLPPEIIPTITFPDPITGQPEKIPFDKAFPPPGKLVPWSGLSQSAQGKLYDDWSAVYDFITEPFQHVTPPVTLNMPAVVEAFQKPLERMLQIVATNVEYLKTFLEQYAISELELFAGLQLAVARILATTEVRFQNQRNLIDAIRLNYIPHLQLELQAVRASVATTAVGVIRVLQVWTTNNVYIPLQHEIAVERVTRQQQVRAITQTDLPALEHRLDVKLAPTIAAVATLAPIVTGIAKWVADCGEPMCQTQGPKTDLGKLLKGLKIAELAAFLAALAALDEEGLDGLITSITKLSSGILDDFESVFLGGGTLGGTATKAGL